MVDATLEPVSQKGERVFFVNRVSLGEGWRCENWQKIIGI
jgi:hypothetical protein